MAVEDCTQLDKFSKTLNPEFQKELTQYRIKTMSEFVRFLVSKLNRTNSSICAEALEAQTIFTKRVLQVIEVLHNKDATDLAQKSLDLLNSSPTPAQIDQYRQLWVNFLTVYDDTFLQNLQALGLVDRSDLKKTIESLNLNVKAENIPAQNMDLTKISSLLIGALVPSIASSVNEKIAALSAKIKKSPSILGEAGIESEIKSAIMLRIALDKKSVKEMVESLDKVLDKLSRRLIDMIERSDSSTVEIKKIKKQLENYTEESTSNFKIAHKKLFTIALALEDNTRVLSKDLKTHSDEVAILSKKVHQLEAELAEARKDSKEDFLTKLNNRRALDEALELKEAEFSRYNRNYSIAILDLDHFKNVNDTFGHEAGDAVLSAFAKILKKESRTADIVGRFGGEEFIAILSETELKGAVEFSEKVRKQVEKSRFMYKGERIDVTVSIGVSERQQHVSLQSVLNSADEYLYKAKSEGRNQVAYKK